MRRQISIVAAIALLLISVGIIFMGPTVEVQERVEFVKREIPVSVKPFKMGDETVPVEIQCEPVFISEPDTLEQFSCVLINKTRKSIRASGVLFSLIFNSNGKEDRSSRIDVANRFIHPDLSEMVKPLEPGARQFVLIPLPMSERNTVIQGLEFETVYLEFSDGTAVGTNDDSIRLIKQHREGAVRLKNTLRQEFLSKGRSVEAILPRMRENLTEESEENSWTFHERSGGNAYRRFIQGKYETDGIAGVRKILDK